MANPTTNYSFAMPTNSDLVKDLPADFEVFGQAVDTQMKTNADLVIPKTIVDAKGDLIAATAADTVARLAVGTNDQVLTADSTAATGMAWKTSASGGMTLLSTTTLSGTSTTISGISGSYTNLEVFIYGVNMGSDTRFRLAWNGTTTLGYTQSANNSGSFTTDVANYLFLTGSSANMTNGRTDNAFSFTIQNYASAQRKTFQGSGVYYNTANADLFASFFGGGINTTSAISSLTFTNNAGASFSAGTVLIYGVK